MSDYYDIDKPFSIENWNKLIRAVNDKLQNPPEGGDLVCQPIYPIDEVRDPHIWSVGDVKTVRGKLGSTCPEISFDEDLEIWKPEIIDEIETALEQAWCYCCDPAEAHEEEGTRIGFADYEYTIYHGCPDGTYPRPPNFSSDLLEGMTVAKSGFEGRTMSIRYTTTAWVTIPITREIPINCDGTLGKADQSFTILGSHGHVPYCGGLFGETYSWESCCNNWIWVEYVLNPWLAFAESQDNLRIEFEINTERSRCCDV